MQSAGVSKLLTRSAAPRSLFPFEALSRGLHPPCVRFVAGLATRQRNTRFRAVASLSRDRTLTCWVPVESFRHVVLLHGFPFLQALPGAISAETCCLWKTCGNLGTRVAQT